MTVTRAKVSQEILAITTKIYQDYDTTRPEVKEESRLVEDLDFDFLDRVELLIKADRLFEFRASIPQEARCKTVADIIDLVFHNLEEDIVT